MRSATVCKSASPSVKTNTYTKIAIGHSRNKTIYATLKCPSFGLRKKAGLIEISKGCPSELYKMDKVLSCIGLRSIPKPPSLSISHLVFSCSLIDVSCRCQHVAFIHHPQYADNGSAVALSSHLGHSIMIIFLLTLHQCDQMARRFFQNLAMYNIQKVAQ